MRRGALLLLLAWAGAVRAEKTPAPSGLTAVAEAFRAGDFARARTLATPAAIGKSSVPDHLTLLAAEAELLDGKYKEAAAHFRELAKKHPAFATRAKAGLADALWFGGKHKDAVRVYEELLKGSDKLYDAAVVRWRIASQDSFGASVKQWHLIVVETPLHPLAAEAMRRLQKATKASDPLSVAEHIARARNLVQTRAWKQAADELMALSVDEKDAARPELDYWIGTALYKSRHAYEEAAKRLLGAAPKLSEDRKIDALFHGARALSRADKDDEALAGYQTVVEKYPHSKLAAEAAFLIGWLEFNRGQYAAAVAPLEKMLKTYAGSQFAVDARWFLGFSFWLDGKPAEAMAQFDRLADKGGGSLVAGKGRYWQGRALVALGKKAEAVTVWRKIVSDYPLTFYAALARLRLKEAGVELGPFGDGNRASAPAWRGCDGARCAAVRQEPVFRRATELAQAGLSAEAADELRTQESTLIKKYGSDKALPVLFEHYEAAQRFLRPFRLAEANAGGALRVDPQGDADAHAWWQWAYPRAHRAFVEKYGPSGENPPYYLYTIMQKESAFDPNDVSYADAIGLLQMIPPTSKRVGERINVKYTDDILYDPEGNIQFGAFYIGHLLRKFKGQVPIGAGSYNAGPKAMKGWLTKNGTRQLDEFVELCSYTQTREYMKKVVDIYSHYVWLYDKQDYLPSLTVDAVALEDDGIDY